MMANLRLLLCASLLATLLYGVFFMEIGELTPYEHGLAISTTEPAQKLADDLSQAGREALRQMGGSLEPVLGGTSPEDATQKNAEGGPDEATTFEASIAAN